MSLLLLVRYILSLAIFAETGRSDVTGDHSSFYMPMCCPHSDTLPSWCDIHSPPEYEIAPSHQSQCVAPALSETCVFRYAQVVLAQVLRHH